MHCVPQIKMQGRRSVARKLNAENILSVNLKPAVLALQTGKAPPYIKMKGK